MVRREPVPPGVQVAADPAGAALPGVRRRGARSRTTPRRRPHLSSPEPLAAPTSDIASAILRRGDSIVLVAASGPPRRRRAPLVVAGWSRRRGRADPGGPHARGGEETGPEVLDASSLAFVLQVDNLRAEPLREGGTRRSAISRRSGPSRWTPGRARSSPRTIPTVSLPRRARSRSTRRALSSRPCFVER